MKNPLTLTPTDFIAVTNQILETSFGHFYIEGELSQFRISKNKWVYFDIKDEYAKVSFFGSVYMLPGPLQDGMVVRVGGTARMHPQYGFSVTAQTIEPVGEGSLYKALELLRAQLEKEGLFAQERKRTLPRIPHTIALVSSIESAAYADFIKIAQARWPFTRISVYDTLVQGENAPESIVRAIHNAHSGTKLADALVVVRGGGSADDLAAFNDERVVRAIATSRIPTVVAIGHEVDTCLSELVADMRASTPSNAAELLLPDKHAELARIVGLKNHLRQVAASAVAVERKMLHIRQERLRHAIQLVFAQKRQSVVQQYALLQSYNPMNVLERGYVIVRGAQNEVIKTAAQARRQTELDIQFTDAIVKMHPIKEERHGTKE